MARRGRPPVSPDDYPGFSNRLAKRLIQLGYVREDGKPDVAEFCRDYRWSTQSMYTYLAATTAPSPRSQQKLAHDLEATAGWLMYGAGAEPKLPRGRQLRRASGDR